LTISHGTSVQVASVVRTPAEAKYHTPHADTPQLSLVRLGETERVLCAFDIRSAKALTFFRACSIVRTVAALRVRALLRAERPVPASRAAARIRAGAARTVAGLIIRAARRNDIVTRRIVTRRPRPAERVVEEAGPGRQSTQREVVRHWAEAIATLLADSTVPAVAAARALE
jgi:hypothetical protein